MKSIIHIVAGGPPELIPDLNIYKNRENIYWIGVDRGAKYLLERGITPALAVGDFDSITDEDFEKYLIHIDKIEKYNPVKDETDMELALRLALKNSPGQLRVFGGTGGRLDHMIANIMLLVKLIQEQPLIRLEILDRQNSIEIKAPGRYQLAKDESKPYISFIPISEEIKSITLTGFKYPLKNGNISLGSTLCISNELIHQYGTYSFKEGILLVIRSSDRSFP